MSYPWYMTNVQKMLTGMDFQMCRPGWGPVRPRRQATQRARSEIFRWQAVTVTLLLRQSLHWQADSESEARWLQAGRLGATDL